jgi:serine/threonine protein kinase
MIMDNLDAQTFGQQAVQLGLLAQDQLMEALDEAGGRNPDLQLLLRVLERRGLMTNWQTGKVLKGDTDGYFLGGYRLLYKIKSGSFGRVFRADDPRSHRVVAIKVLRRRWSEDPQRIALFHREGRVGMTLKHPNIVEVIAVDQDASSGQFYIVMEFVEGGNLREILEIRKTMSASEALRIIEESAAGLAYAFTRHVTHRDVKLTNILVSTTGEAKLVDFGLAKIMTALGQDEEKVDRTVDYAGLERATNTTAGDVRSDIYFLGAVLYEMLTGRSPLEMSRDRYARMNRRRFDEVQPMRPGEVPGAPPSVYALVESMMALRPDQRPQTPSQLIDRVKAVRREVEGAQPGSNHHTNRSVFIAEADERLQEGLRDKFKEHGYRVFLASDPTRALDRFRQQPYDALIVDVGTTGEDGLLVFDQVRLESGLKAIPCAAIAILSEDQADWQEEVRPAPGSAVLLRPVTFKQLQRKLEELLAVPVAK